MAESKIRTPDGNYFQISAISKEEADFLESNFKKGAVDETLLAVDSRSAFKIDSDKVLYRQFYKGIGFLFPTLKDYKLAIEGHNYWDTNILLDEKHNFVVAFLLKPILANAYLQNIEKKLNNYESFDGMEFYLLKDGSIVILRKRTPSLSDGYWFSSIKDFDFFYYVLSGKEKNDFDSAPVILK